MTNKVQLFAALLLVCMACSNVKETPKGQLYTVIRKGDGRLPKRGEFLIMNMLFSDAKDSVWYDTRKSQIPASTMIGDTAAIKNENGVEELFRLLSKGDSITFKVNAKKLFENTFHQPLPPKIDPKGDFFFAIGIKNILEREEFVKMQNELAAKQNEKTQKELAIQLGKDTVIIDNFLREKNIVAQKTPAGLRYVFIKHGTGPLAQNGQTLKVDYDGYLLNGKHFDTSIETIAKANHLDQPGRTYGPYTVGLGRRGVITGWEKALALMNKGSKITVYIPSSLAYGPQKRPPYIGENSVLVFDLEVVDIK